jgi:hypothetical protein
MTLLTPFSHYYSTRPTFQPVPTSSFFFCLSTSANWVTTMPTSSPCTNVGLTRRCCPPLSSWPRSSTSNCNHASLRWPTTPWAAPPNCCEQHCPQPSPYHREPHWHHPRPGSLVVNRNASAIPLPHAHQVEDGCQTSCKGGDLQSLSFSKIALPWIFREYISLRGWPCLRWIGKHLKKKKNCPVHSHLISLTKHILIIQYLSMSHYAHWPNKYRFKKKKSKRIVYSSKWIIQHNLFIFFQNIQVQIYNVTLGISWVCCSAVVLFGGSVVIFRSLPWLVSWTVCALYFSCLLTICSAVPLALFFSLWVATLFCFHNNL